MQTSGILIHLDPTGVEADVTRDLEHWPDLTLGEPRGHALPAVLEATDGRASVDAVRSLERTAGVRRVDVVFVGEEERPHGTSDRSGPSRADRPT